MSCLTYTQRIHPQCKGSIKNTARLEKEKLDPSNTYTLAGLSTCETPLGG
jgi:hypothetical protein